MTLSNPSSDEEPKKKSLKLLLRLKPVAEVETSVGCIYLYPLRVRDMIDFEKLEPADAAEQVRNFLNSIGSQTLESDEAPERISLDPEIAKRLSDDEVEQLAEAYVRSFEWQTAREGSQERKPVAREAGETASAYLIRLVKDEVEHYHQVVKRLNDKMFGSTQSLFDQVRKSTSALGSTLRAYGELTKFARPALREIQPIRTDHFDSLSRQIEQQACERAEERAEEMELTRLTGQMTAESAKTLKDLAEAATTMMEQMDERDRKSDKFTREQIEAAGEQIKIGIWSIRAAIVLGVFALIVSGLSLFQDWKNNIADNRWQSEVLISIEAGNQQRSAFELENQALREQVQLLDARIAHLEAAQRAGAQISKGIASASRRATSPDSTLSPLGNP